MSERALRRRVFRALDAAFARGAFGVAGSLVGLSAAAIADGLATEWDATDRGKILWRPGSSPIEAAELISHVAAWLSNNADLLP